MSDDDNSPGPLKDRYEPASIPNATEVGERLDDNELADRTTAVRAALKHGHPRIITIGGKRHSWPLFDQRLRHGLSPAAALS